MEKTDDGKLYAIVAGICFIIDFLENIVSRIISIRRYSSSVTLLGVFFWAILVGLVVTLLLGKKKFVIFPVGAYVLYLIILLFKNGFQLSTILTLMGSAALIAALILADNGVSEARMICFLPAG